MSFLRQRRHSLALYLLALYPLFAGPILAAAIIFDVQAVHRLREDVAAADFFIDWTTMAIYSKEDLFKNYCRD